MPAGERGRFGYGASADTNRRAAGNEDKNATTEATVNAVKKIAKQCE